MKKGLLRRIALTVCLSAAGYGFASAQIDADRVMRIGKGAIYYRDYVVAIGYFNQVIGARPWLADPYFYRSVAKISLDDYQGALQDANKCLEYNAFIPGAYLVRGIAEQNTKQFDAAEHSYRMGLKFEPNNEGLALNLTNLLLYRKKYAAADSAALETIKYFPKSIAARMMQAQAVLGLQDTVRSMNLIDSLLKKNPDYSPAFLALTDIYYHKGDLKEALRNINQAIKLSPLDIPPYIDRGIIRYQLNDFRGAMADYDHVLSKEPNQKIALYNRAQLNSYVGYYSKALEDFEHLLKIDPDNFFAIYNRAMLRLRQGNFGGAVADLNRVLSKYPDFVVAYIARSTAYRNLGRMKEAERDYNKAIERDQAVHKLGYKPKKPMSSMQGSRDERDENIEKYNLLVMSTGNVEAEAQYEGGIRGRIQDRNVNVDRSPLLVPTYFSHVDAHSASVFYIDTEIDKLNARQILLKPLNLTSATQALDEEDIKSLHADIKRISNQMDQPFIPLRRGIDYLLLQDFQQAESDFSQAIRTDKSALSYTLRAIAIAKQAIVDRNARREAEAAQEKGKKILSDEPKNGAYVREVPFKEPSMADARIRKAISDLDTSIRLNSRSILAYYTRAWLLSELGDKNSAIEDYSKAIKLYPKFADAYFNRGLLELSMGQVKMGTIDLSKAGELGMYEVYNILKRLNN